MNAILKSAMAMAGLAMATQAAAQITFYEHEGFRGRSFITESSVGNVEKYGFNDRASSVVVANDRWEVCEDARFKGQCMVLRPGRYSSLAEMGLNDRISSVRIVNASAHIEPDRYAPAAITAQDYRRHGNERLYEVPVTSVREVVAAPEQRCWVEHRQESQERSGANVPGAVVGAVLGGILGHQVGSGRGNDVATVGGAVVGGAIGANVGRDGGGSYDRDVRRCDSVPTQGRTEYWDVTYNYRGQEHRVQMSAPPGRTVSVNSRGEPRT